MRLHCTYNYHLLLENDLQESAFDCFPFILVEWTQPYIMQQLRMDSTQAEENVLPKLFRVLVLYCPD